MEARPLSASWNCCVDNCGEIAIALIYLALFADASGVQGEE